MVHPGLDRLGGGARGLLRHRPGPNGRRPRLRVRIVASVGDRVAGGDGLDWLGARSGALVH